jgi:hypothetical protein
MFEPEDQAQEPSQPAKVRLPGFLQDEEIGLGDVIKRVTHTLGVKPCGGCERRAKTLNRWVSFGGK